MISPEITTHVESFCSDKLTHFVHFFGLEKVSSNERAARWQVDAEMGEIILKELKAAQPCELVETDGAPPAIQTPYTKSMSPKYEPSSESLHISVKKAAQPCELVETDGPHPSSSL